MDREAANEASRLWVEAAAQTPEAQALIALGWQVVSPYGGFVKFSAGGCSN
ncbi:hypothetical protein [Burkholderia glumae]|uniref:hypothetical protein n=1 Tax=Burkholderia glumae TaxID=337 RepID=UPI003B9C61FE